MSTRVVFKKKCKFKDAIAFTGLPGIGLVGKICVDYMLKELKAESIADIYSNSFPPSIHTKSGIIGLIKDEISHLKHNGKDFLFVSGPIQPSLDLRSGSAEEHYEFSQKLVDELKNIGVKEVYTLAGINVGERRVLGEPKIVVAATNQKILADWVKLGAGSDKPEGLISGAAGLVLGLGQKQGIEGACIMGETNARLIYGDHGAAKKLLELLIKKFGFEIDMSRMEKEAKKIEKAFKQLSKKFTEEEEIPSSGLTYVR